MGEEREPIPAPIHRKNVRLTMALVEEGARVIVVCHKCGVLYSATKRDCVTSLVAERTALGHGNFFDPGHHVSVVSGESTASLEETLTVNENPKSKPTPPSGQPFFFIPEK